MAADVGTLQRLPKIVGNDSLVRELVYTARRFQSDEALSFGLVSRVFPDRDACVSGAIEMAELIASKSPVAVTGSKVNLVYSRDHTVQEGLDFVASVNGVYFNLSVKFFFRPHGTAAWCRQRTLWRQSWHQCRNQQQSSPSCKFSSKSRCCKYQ